MQDQQPEERARVSPGASLIALVFLACAARLIWIIDEHAVNLLYWDQYTLYSALVDGANPWELFRFQHGPHRQGVGFLVTAQVAEWTAWNTRVEAFVIGATIVLAAALALGLKRRLFGRLTAGDAVIPLLMMTPAQYGLFIHTPNLSHSAAPLAGLMLFAGVFTLDRATARYVWLVIADFLLIHTGFGVFVGPLTPVIMVLLARGDAREGTVSRLVPVLAFSASLAILGLFGIGWTSKGGFGSAAELGVDPIAYLHYVALMFANLLGLKGSTGAAAWVGGFVTLTALGVAAEQTIRLWRGDDERAARLAIVSLVTFTLGYALVTAWGRVQFGLSSAQASRYVALMIPGLLGLYLRLQLVPGVRWRQGLSAASVVAILLATVPMRDLEARYMASLSRGKRIWVETYLETGSLREADRRSRVRAYPNRHEVFDRVLGHAREHRLNFFHGVEGPPADP